MNPLNQGIYYDFWYDQQVNYILMFCWFLFILFFFHLIQVHEMDSWEPVKELSSEALVDSD